MVVRVLFFGVLKDVTGCSSENVEMPEDATVAALLAHYRDRHPRLGSLMSSLAVAVNQAFAAPTDQLHPGDEIALLPPVSGGNLSGPLVRIVQDPIVPHDIISPLERPEDGAICIFDGIVRDHSRDRRTLYLEYEAYEEMALKQMNALVDEALAKFAIRNVALVHRLGHLDIGESSVLIAVYSAHRAPAFEACRWLIDTLKRTVPIWKKEFFEDGEVWADGEPFPDAIRSTPADNPPASK